MVDTPWLWMALAAYGLAAGMVAARAVPAGRWVQARVPLGVGLALGAATLLHATALLTRWQALGHGPFTTLHEILSSNLWSLGLVLALAWWTVREVRHALVPAFVVLGVLALWLVGTDAGPGHLPATYATPLLYLHTVTGKLFLGLLLVAVTLSAVPLWGRVMAARQARGERWVSPADRRFDELAHRFAAFAFVFDTLMLIVGAVWAQDAWGRYWAWDPLETWAFLTWLALAAALHARAALRPSPARFGLWLAGVFVLAFLTFFGVPFFSTTPHQGAV